MYEREPRVVLQLHDAAVNAKRARLAGDKSAYSNAIATIDALTDRLVEYGLCRPRTACDMIDSERARLGRVLA